MKRNKKANQPGFNGVNQRRGMQEESGKEEGAHNVTRVTTDLALGDSERNFGEVSGSTFGADSNAVGFSNMVQKKQGRQDAGKNSDVNPANGESGSDQADRSKNQLTSGTGETGKNKRTEENKSGDTAKRSGTNNGSRPQRRVGGYDGL